MIERPRGTEDLLVVRLREVTQRYDFSTLVTGVSEGASGPTDEISKLFGRGLEPKMEPVVRDRPSASPIRAAEPPRRIQSPVLTSALVALIVSLAVSLTTLKWSEFRTVAYANSPPVNVVLAPRSASASHPAAIVGR